MILRASLSQEINKYNERLMGYLASMSYNYCQLCVTSDPSSMLPVTIEMDGETKHIEDLAGIVVHTKEKNGDDITIDVFVKQAYHLIPVMEAIYTYHPEFKTTLETFENDDTRALDEALEKERQEHPESVDEDAEEERELSRKYIRCVMPPVDKDRRDALMELVKLYRDKCKGDFETLKIRTLAIMAPLFVGVPQEEVDKAKKELDKSADYYMDMADKLTEDKKKQIEEAYQEYIKEHPEGAQSKIQAQDTAMTSNEASTDSTSSPAQGNPGEEPFMRTMTIKL